MLRQAITTTTRSGDHQRMPAVAGIVAPSGTRTPRLRELVLVTARMALRVEG